MLSFQISDMLPGVWRSLPSCFVLFVYSFFLGLDACAKTEAESLVGLPFLSNYSADDFEFHPQNWCIEQDDRGVLFFANTQGLLEFDGVSWRKHELIAGSSITVLKKGENGRLYLGGRGDFGYLEFDPVEGYHYTSLGDLVVEEQRGLINTVWHIAKQGDADREGIYFRSSRGLFYFKDGTVQVFPGSFGFLERVGNVVYVLEKGKGLQVVDDGVLTELQGTERLEAVKVSAMLPYDDDGTVLIASPSDGCFLYHPERGLTGFETDANQFFIDNRLYRGSLVWNGGERLFAFATYHGGVMVLDKQGKVRQRFNQAAGLLDDKTHYVLQDREGALWVSMNNGIARVEYPSPISIFDERLGLKGLAQSAEFYNDELYVGTNFGLFVGKAGAGDDLVPWTGFTAFDGFDQAGLAKLSREIWTLKTYDDSLWVGDTRFAHRIKGNQIVESFDCGASVYAILPLPDRDQDVMLLGTAQGVKLLRKTGESWELVAVTVDDTINTVWSMVQDDGGRIWMGTPDRGVIGLVDLDMDTAEAKIRVYGQVEGVPESWLHVSKVRGRVVVVPETGLYRYEPNADCFVPDELAEKLQVGMDEQVSQLTESPDGSLWLMIGSEEGGICHAVPDSEGGYLLEARAMKRLVDVASLLEIEFDPEDRGGVWLLARDSKIYRYDRAPDVARSNPKQGENPGVDTRRGGHRPGSDAMVW